MTDAEIRAWAKWMARHELSGFEAAEALCDAIDELPTAYLQKQFGYIYDDGGDILQKAVAEETRSSAKD